MACFIVPGAEAVVTTIATKIVEKKEKQSETSSAVPSVSLPFSKKMKWLNHMLWGGSALLAFEHLWHGEVSLFFPFLTAASNPVDAAAMLHEMATVGVTMTAVVTVVWGVMVGVSHMIEKRTSEKAVSALTKKN
ncbi:MAG: hypothetical protein MRZ36_05510 [Eubacterium sp.]|nr:hypothetical protein [Eubacterium sp.]